MQERYFVEETPFDSFTRVVLKVSLGCLPAIVQGLRTTSWLWNFNSQYLRSYQKKSCISGHQNRISECHSGLLAGGNSNIIYVHPY